MSEKVGLPEAVSMAVGGMVGGGIFAVLGVVATSSGTLAWAAFVVAGLLALSAGYSLLQLNGLCEQPRTPVGYVQQFADDTTLSGIVGWTFVFGYVGTMAMYAHAFGGYFTRLVGVSSLGSVPLSPAVSVLTVASFVGLNVFGAHASGRAEDALVGLKVAILLLFGVGGAAYGATHGGLSFGLSNVGVGPLVAAAISFVAFEGWELLLFDQESIEDPRETVKKAIYISIVGATALYVLVALVTTNLAGTQAITQHAETALAVAARPFLGQAGFVLISIAALFSTGSAINATLFSSARLSKRLVADDLLPSRLRDESTDEPIRPLFTLGVLAAAFASLGSLDAISSFASLAFITIFGGLSFLAFREREDAWTAVIPAVGTVGAAGSVTALLWHLFRAERGTFWTVLLLAIIVVGVELLYFERDAIVSEAQSVETRVESEL
ncbi:cationic amino acid transporter [Haloferax larsenii JCM 13917]|nr:APC family permease [Haloferax larsenii]ELZ74353.1 cationic amino acid transporter [Haloferax larsenii JCM 13917]